MRRIYKTGIKPKKEKISLFGGFEENGNPGNQSMLIFSGSRELHIDGFRCISEYNDKLVKINLIKGVVTLQGEELFISTLGSDEIIISGRINCVEFC
ncbi:MAG: YabP/YqfC family sporulation protein [Clostridiales bacterium]|nr:YabP/YqfC family sporulation protein [Candidatus Equinaster intestinalis]